MASFTRRFSTFTCTLSGDAIQTGPAVTPYVHLRLEAGSVSEVEFACSGLDAPRVTVRGLPEAWYTLGTCPPPASPAAGAPGHLLVLHPPQAYDLAPVGEHDFTMTVGAGNAGGEPVHGRLTLLPPMALTPQSRYLDYLPALFRETDPYLGKLLMVFQSVLDPIEALVDAADLSSSPDLAPARYLPWLARWVGAPEAVEGDPPHARRTIARTAALARWNGTRRALRERLQDATGAGVLLVENTSGMRLGQDAALGLTTVMGRAAPHLLSVTLTPPPGQTPSLQEADRVLATHKPAWVQHTLHCVPLPGGQDA